MSFRFDEHPDEERKLFRVVAALLCDGDKILLTQRWPAKHLGLTWEFPGGKVEQGETDQEALKRELSEELGIEVNVGTCCFETKHGYGNREVHLLIYRCCVTDGKPKPVDVKAIEWVDKTRLTEKEFPPADLLFVQELMAGRIKLHDDADLADDDDDEITFKPAQVVRVIKR